MPLFVDLFIAIGRLLFTPITKFFYSLLRMDDTPAPLIADTILAIVTVVCLIIELITVVGLDHLRSDIWVRNFLQSIAPPMTVMGIFLIIIQVCVINSLKKTSAISNPKKHKRLTNIAMPEMINLMVTL